MATKPEYKGFLKQANEPETDRWIEVFVSDWNGDYFGFYAYIDFDTYKEDIENIWKLTKELNWMDGDVYIELIDHSPQEDIKEFYNRVYDKGYFDHHAILFPETWEKYWGDKLKKKDERKEDKKYWEDYMKEIEEAAKELGIDVVVKVEEVQDSERDS